MQTKFHTSVNPMYAALPHAALPHADLMYG
jgi:hypothetical protein